MSEARTTIAGGWSPFEAPTAEEKLILKEALLGLLGVDYLPIAVSKQVVNGMNYRFISKATVVYPGAKPYLVEIFVHVPPGGKPELKNIKNVTKDLPETAFLSLGGWSDWHPLTPGEKVIFHLATKDILGVVYDPIEVRTQVVAGMNLEFKAVAHPVVPHSEPYDVIVSIFQPLDGAPYVESITKVNN
ncbi:hypothetical protein [Aureibacter tunicatorum]|uniref:Uncharacterized protein n=1 Tax=Aureibacter tunicatorum TaxID=866807 RepID=A0AAE3XPP5_9BACT|nr:hypothetical protein [Aureibacter tunicatorum]MDR6240857.1 hypothetical protein [Aureibacter tunicatorum]BDD06809.1 hypothetical protein AUTU_42920 [Aureibacter tunicatorum]